MAEDENKYNVYWRDAYDSMDEKIDAWIDDIRIGNKQRTELETHWTRQQEQLDNLEKKISIAEAYELHKRVKLLEARDKIVINNEIFDIKKQIEKLEKHTHHDLKLKGDQNFDEIRDLYKELSELKGLVDDIHNHHIQKHNELKEQLGKGGDAGSARQTDEKPPEYRSKPVEERRANYESRMTKDGVPISSILEKPPEPYAYRVLNKEGSFDDYDAENYILVEKAVLKKWIHDLKEGYPRFLIIELIEKYIGEDKE